MHDVGIILRFLLFDGSFPLGSAGSLFWVQAKFFLPVKILFVHFQELLPDHIMSLLGSLLFQNLVFVF